MSLHQRGALNLEFVSHIEGCEEAYTQEHQIRISGLLGKDPAPHMQVDSVILDALNPMIVLLATLT